MFQTIVRWWDNLTSPKPPEEPGPCESGECGQALEEARALKTKIQVLCALMGSIKAIVDAALLVISMLIPLLIVAVIVGWFFPGVFIAIMMAIVLAIVLPIALAPIAAGIGVALGLALARADEVGNEVVRICPLECYQGQTRAFCPLVNYRVPNVMDNLLP